MPKYGAVVADASPLISLEKLADGFSLLRHTCAKLVVPEVVAQEVAYFLREEEDYFDRHKVRRFVEVELVPAGEISPREEQVEERGQLGLGERYAIEVARSRGVPLLVEERRARRLAREDGLRVFGAAAVVKIAYDERGIERERAVELLHGLFEVSRINRKVLERMLQALGR